jgi:hypothetical protein
MADFKFNPKTQRYQYTSGPSKGKFVSNDTLRGLTSDYIAQQSETLQAITQKMLNKKMGVNRWMEEVAGVLKTSHINGYTIGVGGKAQLDSSHYGSIGAILKEEYKYLHQFARDILDKKLSKAQIKARMDLYAGSIRRSFEKGREKSHDNNGYKWERRDRHATDSCADCIGYSSQGWVAIGSLPPPGERCQCQRNCKCSKSYSNSADKPVNNILDSSFGWIGNMKPAATQTQKPVDELIESIRAQVKAQENLLQSLSNLTPEQRQILQAKVDEMEDMEDKEDLEGRIELSVEGFYNGSPKPAELKAISQWTGYAADPEDWEMVTLRASDNLAWMSYPAAWHPNVLQQMVMQFPGKTLLLDHNSYRVENAKGFFVKSALVSSDSVPADVINNLGRGKINRAIVKEAGGWLQVYVMAAIHKDNGILVDRIKARSIQDVSTGSLLSGVHQYCNICSKKMGRNVEVNEKDADGRYICPHEVPTPWMLMLKEMGYLSEDAQFMDYVTIDGEGQVHNETSFVVEGNLCSAGVIRS